MSVCGEGKETGSGRVKLGDHCGIQAQCPLETGTCNSQLDDLLLPFSRWSAEFLLSVLPSLTSDLLAHCVMKLMFFTVELGCPVPPEYSSLIKRNILK